MSDLKITKGNTFRTILEIKAYRYDGKEIEDFDLSNCTDVTVKCRINGVIREITNFRPRGANELEIQWPSTSKSGAYTIEVSGRLRDHYWRYYSKDPIFTIVETTEEQNIPEDVILKRGTYYVEASKIYLIPVEGSEIKIDPYTYNWIVAGVDTGVSAKGPKGDKGEKGDNGDVVNDYNDLINTPNLSLVAYTGNYNDLYNTPTIPTVPTRLTQLINDADFVTTSYVVKNYYNKTQIDEMISQGGDSGDQVQSDWNESDQDSKAYIKNKPTVPTDNSIVQLIGNQGYLKASDLKKINNQSIVKTQGDSDDITITPGSGSQDVPVQSNWTESDTTSLAYILNKPDLSVYALNSTLTNYYPKSEVYNKTEIDSMISGSVFTVLTQAQYNALATKSPDVLYVITT